MCAQRKIQPAIPENVRSTIIADTRTVANASRINRVSMIRDTHICEWCKKIRFVHIAGKSYMEDEEKRVYPQYCTLEKKSTFVKDSELSQWSATVYKLHGGI